jgi:hypothetical protein
MPGFICRQCGQYHDHLPLSYGFSAPAYWSSELANESTCELQAEICIIHNEYFFVKGNIEIPVYSSGEVLIYTIWATVSQADFSRTLELWQSPERAGMTPFVADLANQLAGYSNTIGLKVKVHSREVGLRPLLQVIPRNHRLAQEQQAGINTLRVQEIAELVRHPVD